MGAGESGGEFGGGDRALGGGERGGDGFDLGGAFLGPGGFTARFARAGIVSDSGFFGLRSSEAKGGIGGGLELGAQPADFAGNFLSGAGVELDARNW